ncbi:response regulator transcription factor, partial [Methylobacterium tarhaniae]|uniref:response regulator transcription factor n=1 Tax=Methylobacterium tarhaniae TaxID=1187852 RepID=UPI003D085B36
MTGSAPHVVVVDDEADARAMVGDYLRMHGFEVSLCDGGGALRRRLAEITPDLIVLDLNMPEEDGLSIVRDLKGRSSVPIIMLTATASPIDRVVGLELGADDYLPKPCELRELVARIRSVMRRAAQARAPSEPARPAMQQEAQQGARQGTPQGALPGGRQENGLRFGRMIVDTETLRLRDEAGAEQILTRSEYALLKAFLDNPKRDVDHQPAREAPP